MAGEPRVTQAGALVDAGGDVPPRITQAGALVDAERATPPRITQAGALVDVERATPPRITQAGLLIDARHKRPERADDCIEIHVEDIIGRYLAQLDGAFDVAYLATLADCGGGQFRIHASDPKATAANLMPGNVVRVRYRGVDVGAWVIESLDEPLVDNAEEAGRIIMISGRGLLGLLEEGIVYPSDLADPVTAERKFTAMTKASILLALYNEFIARGGGALNMNFTAEMDSAEQAWTDTVSVNFRAGQTLLDVARNLAGLGLELVTQPDRTVEAYVSAGTDRSAVVILRHGQAILRAKRSTEAGELTTAVLGEGQGCYVESIDAGALATYRRREQYLAVRNTGDSGQVGVANGLLLAGYRAPRAAYELEVIAAPWRPWFDYQLGDVVRVEIPGQVSDNFRILSISVRTGGGPHDLRVTLELNAIRLEYLQRAQRAFEASLLGVQPGPGAAEGLASAMTATPVGSSGTGLAADAIKDTHVDWGTGVGQVSAADVPIADADGYYASEDVEAALVEIAEALGSLTPISHAAVSLDANADTLLSLSTQQIGLDTQAANTALRGPASGAAAIPTFRAAVAADLSGMLADGQVFIGRTGAAPVATTLTGTGNRITVTGGAGTIVLSAPQDIHTTATPTFGGVIAAYLRPASDSTTALQLQNAAGMSVLTVDTTNLCVGVGVAPSSSRLIYGMRSNSIFGLDIRLANKDTAATGALYGVVTAAMRSVGSVIYRGAGVGVTGTSYDAQLIYNAATGVNIGTDTITVTGAVPATDTPIIMSCLSTETMPAPLTVNATYYVIRVAANQMRLAAAPGGAALDITATGTGTIYCWTGTAYSGATLRGLEGSAYVQGLGTYTEASGLVFACGHYGPGSRSPLATITSAHAVYGIIYNNPGSTITTAYGLRALFSTLNSGGAWTTLYGTHVTLPAAGTLGTAYGHYVAASSLAANAKYGLYVAALSGATNNYSIYTNAGDVRLMASGTDKLGLWGATPVAQPTTAGAAATLVGGGGTPLTDTDTFDGYTLKQIVKALRSIGALA